ncbi:hypothetical protein [Tibeticola sp.]|uniref:DUF6969 family protein n=1 Tax=Tibeticola sp. TaxID=2005368 RepID=UPI00258C2E14|nr:hypothetical protein [Tibeticola sp.]MCI4440123.1 hypothetical protein [Tibeticola sp.]
MRTEEINNLRERRLAAAETVAALQLHYARAGRGLAEVALAGARTLEPLRHYPARDVVDPARGTRFYYHAHTSHRYPAEEHGHFHLFVYPSGQPSGPDFFHLAGLSLDARGMPLRWFTTNRWVTGERWHSADALLDALPRFAIETRGRLAPLARWLTAMVQLYAPQIRALILRRDARIARKLAQTPGEALFEDRRLDVVSECRVSLPQTLAQIAG